jgi:enolase
MHETTITAITLRKIYDSRGSAAIECDVYAGRAFARASAPAGASTGKAEAVAYPKGVDEALRVAKNKVIPRLIGADAAAQESIDALLHSIDATENFSVIGGNPAIAISLACAKAAAAAAGKQLYEHVAALAGSKSLALPLPLSKIIGGGKHALNACDIQEFLSVPAQAKTMQDAIETNATVHKSAAQRIKQRASAALGRDDESGWVAKLSTEEALDILASACEEHGAKPALDIAASSLYDEKTKRYVYPQDKRSLSEGGQLDFVLSLIKKYKLAYMEDAFNEDAFAAFAELTKKAGSCLVCGDDLFVTNKKLLQRGIEAGACNSIIIKPNQIGTLSDTIETAKHALANGYVPVASHRSGETCDAAIAHIAVALRCPLLKTNVVGGERVEKFNELVRIEEASVSVKPSNFNTR